MNAPDPIRKGRKFDQVLDGARKVFLREGYEGASVDVIARDAGVSKATLYSYFPDKQALFLAVLNAQCDLQRRTQVDLEFHQRDVQAALRDLALSILEFLTSEDGVAIFRVCVAEAQRFPELGRAFYETGPAVVMAQMANYLSSEKPRSLLEIDDPLAAADLFMQLCRGDLMVRRIFCVSGPASQAEIQAAADAAVTTFMARYARKSPHA